MYIYIYIYIYTAHGKLPTRRTGRCSGGAPAPGRPVLPGAVPQLLIIQVMLLILNTNTTYYYYVCYHYIDWLCMMFHFVKVFEYF